MGLQKSRTQLSDWSHTPREGPSIYEFPNNLFHRVGIIHYLSCRIITAPSCGYNPTSVVVSFIFYSSLAHSFHWFWSEPSFFPSYPFPYSSGYCKPKFGTLARIQFELNQKKWIRIWVKGAMIWNRCKGKIPDKHLSSDLETDALMS